MATFLLVLLLLLLLGLVGWLIWRAIRRPPSTSPPPPPPPPTGGPNLPPSIRILSRLQGDLNVPLTIDYEVTDAESDTASIVPEYSLDNGVTFRAATERAASGSSGTANLATSASGTQHVFVWDAGADLAPALPREDYFARNVIFRLRVFDAQPGNQDQIAALNILAGVRIRTPATVQAATLHDRWGSPLPVWYTLVDQASRPADVRVFYTLDGGLTFQPATEAQGVASDGTTALTTAPYAAGGVLHLFAWDSVADLSGQVTANVAVVITTALGSRGASPIITVDSTIVGMRAGPRPTPPSVSVVALDRIYAPNSIGPHVPVRFIVRDDASMRVDVTPEYSTGGGAFLPAVAGKTSDRLRDLPAPEHWTNFKFVWDVSALAAGAATFRLTSERNGIQAGPSISTGVTITPQLPADAVVMPYVAPTPLGPVTIAVASGDNQIGIARQNLPPGTPGALLPMPLRVTVTTPAGPVAGARVLFAATAGSPMVSFEADPNGWTTTDSNGSASIRVRIEPDAPGTGEILARVVGTNAAARFSFSTRTPRIVLSGTAPASAAYNQRLTLTYVYDADGNPSTVDFLPEPLRPIALQPTVTNGIASKGLLCFPDAGGIASSSVDIYPTILSGTLTVRVADPYDPAVVLDVSIPVSTPKNAQRITGPSVSTSQPQRVTMHLHPTTASSSLVAYPGLTIATPLSLECIDDLGQRYREEITANFYGCAPPAVTRGLTLTYTCSSGTLSKTPTPGTATMLTDVAIESPVYFTPSGTGPWFIYATVNGRIADPRRTPFHWVDTSTQPPTQMCDQQNEIGGAPSYTFIVQAPTDVRFVVATGASAGSIVDEGRAGDRLRLEIGLSPFVAGTAAPLTLSSYYAFGPPAPSYTLNGAPIAFEPRVALHAAGTGRIASDELVLTTDVERTTPLRPLALPFGWLHAHGMGLSRAISIFGQHTERRIVNNDESIEEPHHGAAPRIGADGTVVARTGEFIYSICDFEVRSRPGELTLCRTFKGHLLSEGILGPGWTMEHTDRLEITRRYGARWHTSFGALHDFVNHVAPKGVFFELNTYSDINADHSAFELVDSAKVVWHFNVDGSLRMIRDANRNTIKLRYNDQAQLTEIEDALQRRITLDYYQAGAGVPDEVAGKLLGIRDFAGRTFSFEYYGPNDPDGGPGWLKKTLLPAADARVGGVQRTGYRRSESYKYEMSATNALDCNLTVIVDSEDRDWLVIGYDVEGRVIEQQFGASGAPYQFDYSAPGITLEVDRGGTGAEFQFEDSPYPAAAVPTRIDTLLVPDRIVHIYKRNDDGIVVHHITGTSGGGSTIVKTEEWLYRYDSEATTPVRSRGNLLTAIQRSRSGDRITSYAYERDRNQLVRQADPRANDSGNSEMYAVRYYYSTAGNLVAVTQPSTEHVAMTPNVGGASRWNEAWQMSGPQERYEYNSFGLVKRYTDWRNVVTLYSYHPESSPGGGTAGVSPDNGGFLAMVQVDAEDSPLRQSRVPGFQGAPSPLDTRATQWAYSTLGDVIQYIDPVGIVTSIQTNALHQVTRAVQAARAPAPLAALAITTRSEYDEHGNLVRYVLEQPSASSSAGGPELVSEWDYDQLGNVIEHRSTADASRMTVTRLGYDDEEELVSLQPPDATSGSYSASALTIDRDPRGLPTHFRRGTGGTGTALPPGPTMSWTTAGTVESFTDAAAKNASYQYDEFGEPLAIVDVDGELRRTAPDPAAGAHRMQRHKAGGGETWDYDENVVDEHYRVRRSHRLRLQPPSTLATTPATPAAAPVKEVNEYFDPAPGFPPASAPLLPDGKWGGGDGRNSFDVVFDGFTPTRFVDDENRFGLARLDAHGNPVEIGGSTRAKVYYSYDKAGRVLSVRSQEQSSTRHPMVELRFAYEYDALGRVVKVTDGASNSHTADYDETGYTTREVDALGNETRYRRDAQGHTLERKTVAGTTVLAEATMSYDDSGRLLSHRDAAGFVTTWQYDPELGRPLSTTYAPSAATGGAPAVSSVTYDSVGRTETITDPNGTRLRYTYDVLGRITSIRVDARGAGVIGTDGFTFSQDETVTVSSDVTSGYRLAVVRDSTDRVVHVDQNGRIVESSFNGSGRRTHLKTAHSDIELEYDRTSVVRRVLDARTEAIALNYLSSSRVQLRVQGPVQTQLTFADGTLAVTRIAIGGANPWGTLEFSLQRDALLRLTERRTTIGGASDSRAWTYDGAGRILTETHTPRGGATPSITITRTYDNDGVVIRQVETFGSATSTYDQQREEGGRIVSRNATALAYDRNGNLLDDGTQTYAYDAWNRLVEVRRGGALIASYEYDPTHRLIARTVGGLREEFLYDGWHLLEAFSAGSLTERYVYTDGLDDLIAVVVGGMRYTVLYDAEGSVFALVDAQQNVVQRYEYLMDGRVTATDAWGAPTGASPICRMLFHRQFYDAATGLYLFRLRWYHPILGQFLAKDPCGYRKGTNLYALSHNDPINFHDATGMDEAETPGAGKTHPPVEQESVAWSFVKGFGEGLVIGGRALANVFTGGAFEEHLTPDDPEDRRLFHMAEVPATISREAIVLAGTLGAGTVAANSSRLARYGVRASEYLNRADHLVGRYQTGKRVFDDLRHGDFKDALMEVAEIASEKLQVRKQARSPRRRATHACEQCCFNERRGKRSEVLHDAVKDAKLTPISRKTQGREGRQDRLMLLAQMAAKPGKCDPRIPDAIRENLAGQAAKYRKQLEAHVARGHDYDDFKFNFKLPKGYQLGHVETRRGVRGRPAREGFDYGTAWPITTEQNAAENAAWRKKENQRKRTRRVR